MNPIHPDIHHQACEFIALNLSYLDNYFAKVEDLKVEGDWKQIILLGELALMDKLGKLEQKAKIHAELSHCFFYLGDYELCKEHAEKCKLAAEYLKDSALLMESLYLLSAYKRTMAQQTHDSIEQKKFYQEAKGHIYEAFKLFKVCDDSFHKAKVLLNAGAAHAYDPSGNWNVAKNWYLEAMQAFQQIENQEAVDQVALHLAALYIQQDDLSSAHRIIDEINFDTLSPKLNIQAILVQAKYFMAMQNYSQACFMIVDAIENAAQMDRPVDIERLNALLEEIRHKDINILEHLSLKC